MSWATHEKPSTESNYFRDQKKEYNQLYKINTKQKIFTVQT